MVRKRPCRVCRRWFWPHPRAGDRQRTCSLPDCQRERHRRACASWRRRHPDYDREDRLRRRLQVPARAMAAAPLRGIDWSAARDAVGLQVAVVIEETGEVLQRWARDAVSAQVTDPQGLRLQVPP
jgi:hypothetical protein